MVKTIGDPSPEVSNSEEYTLLAELIELGISIQQSGGDELIHDAERKWRKNGEDDVEEGQRP